VVGGEKGKGEIFIKSLFIYAWLTGIICREDLLIFSTAMEAGTGKGCRRRIFQSLNC
jgi:hypothetical protein